MGLNKHRKSVGVFALARIGCTQIGLSVSQRAGEVRKPLEILSHLGAATEGDNSSQRTFTAAIDETSDSLLSLTEKSNLLSSRMDASYHLLEDRVEKEREAHFGDEGQVRGVCFEQQSPHSCGCVHLGP